MSRSIWNGIVSFGMVSIPVKLFTATSDKDISFNQLHSTCKGRINMVKRCNACDVNLGPQDIIKGFEYAKGQYAIINDTDLAALPLLSKKVISISQFLNKDEIDPIHYEKTYYLEPNMAAEKPFALLVNALKEKDRTALCKFSLRTKERLCLLRTRGNHLLLTTLLYPDEISVSDGKDFDLPTLSEQEVTMGGMLVDMMTKPFNPGEVKDAYREALSTVIEAKIAGKELTSPVEPKVHNVDNLMDALAATMAAMKASV